MELSGNQQLYRDAISVEKRFTALVREDCPIRTLDQLVGELQDAFQNVIFQHFQLACQEDLEGRLWAAHHKIIKKYQQSISKIQEHGKRKPVELRKMTEAFVSFLKQATRFYRTLIYRFIVHFHLRELHWVLQKFHIPIGSPEVGVPQTPQIRDLVIRSCHRSMIYLGDLSRYREFGRPAKNYGPAIGYYTLAKELLPTSGNSHNQLAVMAMDEGSLLSALYHLYRAVSVSEPFPEADRNLMKSFKKALKAINAGNPAISDSRKEEQVVKDLIRSFVGLHVRLCLGKEFPEYESAESDMLTQLALDLKDRNLSDGMLVKLVLINISAQAYALPKAPRTRSVYHPANFLRLNIASFTTLHQVFQPELERPTGERSSNDFQTISAVGRRMLASLRLYSTWLRTNHHLLVERADSAMTVLVKQLWQTYANTLSLLAATFDITALRKVDYLLEEDKEIMGFKPFESVIGQFGLSWHEGQSDHGHANEEMSARIRLILEDGIILCRRDDVPLTMNGGTITYKEDGILTSTPSIGMNSELNDTNNGTAYLPDDISKARYSMAESVYGQAGTSIVGSTTGSETMTVAMNRMVDALVGPRDQGGSEDGIP